MRGFSFPSIVNAKEHFNTKSVIITGISYEEGDKFNALLASKGIYNVVYYNPTPKSLITFETIVEHKIKMIEALPLMDVYFENEEEQLEVLQEKFPGMSFINL